MGGADNLAPSLVDGSLRAAQAAGSLAEAARGAQGAPQEVCTLIPGLFGIGIQFALCVISVLMLLVKYTFEFPKRSRKVFIMDFVQLMCGSSTVHLLNIVSSILINKINVGGGGAFVQDECNMYFMTTVFDATIGVYIEYKIVRYLAIKRAAQNYLKKNRKSRFTPTVQELADATRFATNSINSLNPNFLVNAASISTAASTYAPGLEEAERLPSERGWRSSLLGLFGLSRPKPESPDNLSADGSVRAEPTNAFEVMDLEALHSERLIAERYESYSQPKPAKGADFGRLSDAGRVADLARVGDVVRVGEFGRGPEVAMVGDVEDRVLDGEQFMHALEDDTTVDEEEELLMEDELPNPSLYSSTIMYNISALYARFGRWSRRRSNREFLLNLYTWLVIVSGLKCVSIIFFTIFSYHINLVTSYVLEVFNNSHRLKLIFVMIISPLFLNVFQYYVTDSIIKIKIPLN